MRRRRFFTIGTLIGLAGCLGNNNGDDGDNNGDNPGREVTVVEPHDGDVEPEIKFEIDQLSSALTPEELPAFTITVRNQSDSPVRIAGWSVAHFDTLVSDPEGLKVISENQRGTFLEDSPEQVHPEGCLTTEYVDQISVDNSAVLEPDDSEESQISVIGDHEAFEGDCVEPGEYTLVQSYRVEAVEYDDEEETWRPVEEGRSFDWGVTLEVSEKE
jgi:hypothetical protein